MKTETTNLDKLGAETDDALLIRYQQFDDRAAYEELDRRDREELVTYACKKLPKCLQADADDMVQEALLRFCQDHKRYAPQSDVSALLHLIVTRRCQDHLDRTAGMKRDYRRTVHPDGIVTRSEHGRDDRNAGCAGLLPDPKADPAILDRKIDFDEMLSTLTPEQAEALRLRVEGHTAESAAEALNVPIATIEGRIERGIKALREQATDNTDND
ncbi:MAG: RNA polymerase sigma factor [Methanoculleus marisnigri]|nr:RNA polymerase sigma factor [Methanoculleus marisnigri]